MERRLLGRYCAEAIPIVAFNILYFALVEDFTAAKWIGWLCLHVAYAVFVLSMRGVESRDRKAVFGYSRAGVAFGLVLTTAVAFVAICLMESELVKWALVVEVIATAALGVLYFAVDISEHPSRELDELTRRHCAFIATTANLIEEARRLLSETTLKKSVESAYDAVRNGSVASVNEATDIEMDIANDAKRVLELARAGNGGDEILSCSKSIVAAMRKRETVIRSILFARG